MAKIARRSTTPIATGESLIASYDCRELIEMGVVDILQTDINHVGGITALWKVAATANVVGIPRNANGRRTVPSFREVRSRKRASQKIRLAGPRQWLECFTTTAL
jgi:L-alanine-DL-glutamate epimerase-like enolase superfamily enzyme